MASLLLDLNYHVTFPLEVRFGNVHLLNMDHALVGRIAEASHLKYFQYVYDRNIKTFKVRNISSFSK